MHNIKMWDYLEENHNNINFLKKKINVFLFSSQPIAQKFWNYLKIYI